MAFTQVPAAGGASSLRVPTLGPVTGDIQLIAGTNITITQDTVNGTFTFTNSGTDTGITQLTGEVLAGPGSGSQVATLGTITHNILLSKASGDAVITLHAGGEDAVLTKSSTATKLVFIQNNGITGLIIDTASGFMSSGAIPIKNGSQGIRTNAEICAGTQTNDPTAVMQADSTTQGFLPPRMTTTQRDAIATPSEGLFIYNTTTHHPNYWNGSAWTAL